TWTSNEAASTRVRYGISSSYGSTTAETNTSPRVTSHSTTINSLLPCTTYQYSVQSLDAASNTGSSANRFCTTGGCSGEATVTHSTGSTMIMNANGSTGSIALPSNSVSITVPSGYIATNATCPTGAYFQLKGLATSPVQTQHGSPS